MGKKPNDAKVDQTLTKGQQKELADLKAEEQRQRGGVVAEQSGSKSWSRMPEQSKGGAGQAPAKTKGQGAAGEQNPEDPDGTPSLNPLKKDFALYNMGRNVGRHLKEAGHQIRKGRPLNALGVTAGIATSTASGDIFDGKNGVKKGATGVSVNGIWNTPGDATKIANDATKVTGQNTQRIKNGSHFGIGGIGLGDVVQCVSESLGAINTPSLNYADTVREIAKNDPNAVIEATGHSQGASVLNGGAKLVDPEINRRTSVQTFGGQYAPTSSKFRDTYAERSGKGPIGDPVPLLDPRNLLNRLRGKIYQNPERAGHGWEKNYGTDGLRRAEESEKKRR